MADPQIEKLLILQDRDVTLQKIRKEQARVPHERSAIEAKIAEETANIENAKATLKAKELERKETDLEVQAKNSALERFRNQQLLVKKNDEYRALTHQIEQTTSEISQLEEREIEIMLEIDSVSEAFEQDKGAIEQRIESSRKQIELLAQKVENLNESESKAVEEAKQAEGGIDSNYIEHYFRVKKLVKRAPYVSAIREHKCSGCHLRVSNEVSRGAMNGGELHFCDQCARIVYA